VEAALPDDLYATLVRLCALFEVPCGPAAGGLRSWQGTPLQEVFETASVVGRVEELMGAGVARSVAERRAAAELGVPWDTVRTRLLRWFETSREPRETESHNEPRTSRKAG
jgi:hypothetical protein